MNEREAYIALNMMDKVGPVGVRSLAAELGSVSAIFDAPEGGLMRARGVGRDMASTIATPATTARGAESGINFKTI